MIYLLFLAMALYGACHMSVQLYKELSDIPSYDIAYQRAKRLVSEKLSNCHRITLPNSSFPYFLNNDIKSLLSEEEYNRWIKRFNMVSEEMQKAGEEENIPYYDIKLYVPNDTYRNAYEIMIKNIAGNILSRSNCFKDVYITWYGRAGDYEWVKIRYARQLREYDSLCQLIRQAEQDDLFADSITATDTELEDELKNELH